MRRAFEKFKAAEDPVHCVFTVCSRISWNLHPFRCRVIRTSEVLLSYLQPIIGKVTVIRNQDGGMRELVMKRKSFPSRVARFCTGELKMQPMKNYLRSLDEEVVNAVGVRAQESARRALYTEWEYSSQMRTDVWRPILKWTEKEVINMHHRHNIRPNPLYLMGTSRVGCWPCIFSSKASLRVLATEDPQRINDIRQLEFRQFCPRLRYCGKGYSNP